jgi:predicted benzoate:H+ symporter BenE
MQLEMATLFIKTTLNTMGSQNVPGMAVLHCFRYTNLLYTEQVGVSKTL